VLNDLHFKVYTLHGEGVITNSQHEINLYQ